VSDLPEAGSLAGKPVPALLFRAVPSVDLEPGGESYRIPESNQQKSPTRGPGGNRKPPRTWTHAHPSDRT